MVRANRTTIVIRVTLALKEPSTKKSGSSSLSKQLLRVQSDTAGVKAYTAKEGQTKSKSGHGVGRQERW